MADDGYYYVARVFRPARVCKEDVLVSIIRNTGKQEPYNRDGCITTGIEGEALKAKWNKPSLRNPRSLR